MSKIPLVLLITFFISLQSVTAQRFEVGMGAGFTNYRGDLNPNFNPLTAMPAMNLMGRYNHSKSISLGLQAMGGFLHGADKLSRNPYNKTRDYEFKSSLIEMNARLEYNFNNFRFYDSYYRSDYSPILFGGIGGYVAPNSKYINDQGIVEEQGQINSPNYYILGGVGYKRKISDGFNISAEMGARVVFDKRYADDIDGLSFNNELSISNAYLQSSSVNNNNLIPNTTNKDYYFYTCISISYVFRGVRCPKR